MSCTPLYFCYKNFDGRWGDQDWFARYFAEHADKIKWHVPENIDTQRAATNTEEALEADFEGIYGLRQELIKTGIIDPETDVIADPRRVLNRDELPQFIDYGTNKGNAKPKVAGSSSNRPPVQPNSSNRTSNTVDMTIGLDGFQYGLHVLMERTTITEDLCIEQFAKFDKKINEQFGVSTYGLISTTERGVQTGSSLLEVYRMLDKELTDRGVPRPVVMLTDAHASRQDEDVLEFCREVQIRQFAEPPATSGWAQALDQYNKMFHESYNKERRRYKQEQRDRDMHSMTQADFLCVVERVWFHWWSPADRRNAFKKVGITIKGIDKSQINRSKFVMPPRSPQPERISTTIPSPAGVRRRSNEWYKMKLEAAEDIILQQTQRPVGPKEAGVLEVDVVAPVKSMSRTRVTSGFGSYEMQDLLGKRKAQETERQDKERESSSKRSDRVTRKANEEAEATARWEGWDACRGACVCVDLQEEEQCRWLSLKGCRFCHCVMKKKCAKKACKEKQAAEESLEVATLPADASLT